MEAYDSREEKMKNMTLSRNESKNVSVSMQTQQGEGYFHRGGEEKMD